jgi:hypothetical protein
MKHDVGGLRRRVHALGSRHRGARVPPALRAAIAAYARDQRATGASWRAIAARLGVSSESIRRWALTGPARDSMAALVPVHVVAEAAVKTLTVWSPTGYRVEELSVAETAELLRRLA